MSRFTVRRLVWVTLAAGLLIAWVACAPSLSTRFPHLPHLTQAKCGGPDEPRCLTCASCHDGVGRPGARLYPTIASCTTCHKPQDADRLANTAPALRPDSTPQAVRGLKFAHDTHLPRPAIHGQCVTCHAGVADSTGKGMPFPTMTTCLSCHQRDFDTGRCGLCHDEKTLPDLVPQTLLRHDDGWVRHHGFAATARGPACRACHTEASCKDCHDTSQTLPVEKRFPDAIRNNFVHRGDFISRHALEARSQPATCQRCHAPSSCDACHVERGVSGGAVGSTSPHPRGFLDPVSPNAHGRSARRDILACASCHDQGPATNCIACHKVGGSGGNPHPNGWTSARATNASMCRYCHVN